MPTLTTTGLVVPSTFPATSYENAHKHITAGHAGTPTYERCCGGWNAISYRYVEARECADQFQHYFVADGAGPPPTARYNQERVIFDFFGSAVSALESCAFAIFAMASLRHAANFPLATPSDERKVTPASLGKKLDACFAMDPLTTVWNALLQDQRYRDLHNVRNILTHRLIVSRHHHLGGALHGTAIWQLTGATITKDMLKGYADDLSDLLAKVIPAAEQFALAHC